MDIINFVFQIPQDQNIEDYKKDILGELLENYFMKEKILRIIKKLYISQK